MPPRLSVIIVSWNSIQPLETCLKSLDALGLDGIETIIVDSASQDGTVRFLRNLEASELRERIGLRVLYHSENVGWARGIDEGSRIASGKWLLLCNPDVQFTESFEEMMRYGDLHRFLVLAPQLITPNGIAQRCLRRITFTRLFFAFTTVGEFLDAGVGRRFVWRDLHYGPVIFEKPMIVDHPSASFFMIRRELLDMLGHLASNDFPLYFGDSDLFMRLQERKIPVVFLPFVRIVHEIGYSKKLVPSHIYQFRRLQSMTRFARRWKMHHHLLTILLFLDSLFAPFLSYDRILKVPRGRDVRTSAYGLKGIVHA